MGGLRDYVNKNRIGQSPVSMSSYKADLLVNGFKESAQIMGARYVLRGLDLVIEPERRR